MELLERSEALAVLDTALESAAMGEGKGVLVRGDAGISKTSLVGSFRYSAAIERTSFGVTDDLATPLPLAPIRDIARMASPALETAIANSADRGELFDLMIEQLERRPRPTIMVVEDVHWADAATLELLTLIGRRIDQFAALLALTYRPQEIGADHPPGAVERILLEPLSPCAVGLLGPELDSEEAHRITGGNPFFVTELVADEGQVSESITETMLARIARLSDSSRSVVRQLAVVPGGLDAVVLDELVGDWAEAAEELERVGLLELRDGLLRFRHELARRAVEAGLGEAAVATRLGLGR